MIYLSEGVGSWQDRWIRYRHETRHTTAYHRPTSVDRNKIWGNGGFHYMFTDRLRR